MNAPKNGTDVNSMFSLDKKTTPAKPLNKAPVNSMEPEYQGAYDAWKPDQNPKANDAMIGKIRPIVDSAIQTYVGSDVSPSVRLRARRLALDGLNSYDPSKSKLKTHMMWHLQGLKRISAKSDQILNVPERVRIDSHYVNTSANELLDKLGRDPNDDELSNFTGLSVKRIGKVRGYKPGISEGAATTSFGGMDGGDPPNPASLIPGQSNRNEAWKEFIYDGLDDRSKFIMEHTLGMNGKKILDNSAVSSKLRITPARVSQIRADIQSKIDNRGRIGL